MRSLIRRQSLRLRITWAFVAASALMAVVLSLATYYSVRGFLESQRVRSAKRQTVFGLLFAREYLSNRPDRAPELASLLQTRGRFEVMVTTPDSWYSSTLSLTPQAIPAGLAALVRREQLAYQASSLGAQRTLVFGAPLPPQGLDLYLFYSLDDVDGTLSLIARVLTVAGLSSVLVAGVLAQQVSRRILLPLRIVGGAAHRVAEGLLETRVESETSDEVGMLAESFNTMAEALQKMIDRERAFVAGVSHELRTPLAALRATSEILAGRLDELPGEVREAVGLMTEDVESLHRLTVDLMEMSEIDSGRASIRAERVDLRALTEAIVRARHRDARIEGPSVSVTTDKRRFERGLGNLIDNAYVHGEGRDVRVTLRDEGRMIAVAVQDSGPGIAVTDRPRLFERFYKADRSRTREHGGVGLGLAIAWENVGLLGGTIDVESPPGGGATFTIRIPLDAPRRTE